MWCNMGSVMAKTWLSLFLSSAVVVLAVLLVHSHRERTRLQEWTAAVTQGVASLARGRANADLSGSNASYFLKGLRLTADVEAFERHFKQYNVSPVGLGCEVDQAMDMFSEQYNQVVREF